MTTPTFSVIVPAHAAEALLPDTLAALAASSLARSRWELIVVDDASPDGTAIVAKRFADRVVVLPAPACGPGGARNAGAAVARGSWLIFIDADVRVHADTLARFAVVTEADDASLVACFGCYDAHPTARGLVSEYRNLLHRAVHLRAAGDAETFWAGCGAVRRDAFESVGGFDTARFPRPQIEDIDLGYRLRDQGGRIVLDPTIEVTHLKRWHLGAMLMTDVRDRGIPWMRLLLERRGQTPATLNSGGGEPARVALAGLGVALLLAAGLLQQPQVAWIGALALLLLMVANLPTYRWFIRERGFAFTLGVVPLHLLHYVGNAVAATLGLLLHLTRPTGGMG